MKPDTWRAIKAGTAALGLATALAVGGCGLSGSDVELNGGVFDALGVSAATSKKEAEPRLAPRAGLVLPPVGDRLPAPGKVQEPELAGEAWPVDPETQKVKKAEALDREQAEFCKQQALQAKTMSGGVLPDGPKGPCTSSLLGVLGLNIGQK